MTPVKHYDFTVEYEQWLELDEDSLWFRRTFKHLLDEWGTFLEANLFY